jgi:hypothetical protein
VKRCFLPGLKAGVSTPDPDDYAAALDALRSDRTVHKIIIEC